MPTPASASSAKVSRKVPGSLGLRPVRTGFDWLMEGAALAGLLAVFGLAAFYWDQIPDGAPRRFRFAQSSTVWTIKNGMWLLMGLNLTAYLALTIGGQSQKLIRVPAELDRAAPHVRPMMFSLLLVLKTVLMLFAAYLTWALVSIGRGERGFLSGWWLTALVLALPLPLALYSMRIRK